RTIPTDPRARVSGRRCRQGRARRPQQPDRAGAADASARAPVRTAVASGSAARTVGKSLPGWLVPLVGALASYPPPRAPTATAGESAGRGRLAQGPLPEQLNHRAEVPFLEPSWAVAVHEAEVLFF